MLIDVGVTMSTRVEDGVFFEGGKQTLLPREERTRDRQLQHLHQQRKGIL